MLMKIKIALTLLLTSACTLLAQTQTPIGYQGYNNGGPQTNPLTFTAFPPAVNGVVIVGTNVYSDAPFTFTPSASGFFSNNITPNSYRVTIPALGIVFYANIPNTATYQSLSLYITNQPVIPGPVTGGGIVAALQGYVSATNGVPLLTTSNPTNAFSIGTPYIAPAAKSILTGYSLGGVLYYTNNNISYQVTVTNGFAILLSTNATWSFLGQNLTNCIDWLNP